MTQNQIEQVDITALTDDAVLLDVREPNEYAAGHAPGAVSIPMGEIRGRLADLPHTDGPLPVICRSGARSQRAPGSRATRGTEPPTVAGGTTAWAGAGKPLQSETGDEPAVVAPATTPPAQV